MRGYLILIAALVVMIAFNVVVMSPLFPRTSAGLIGYLLWCLVSGLAVGVSAAILERKIS